MNKSLAIELKNQPNGAKIKAYIRDHINSISGWLRDEALLVTCILARYQDPISSSGSFVEIGVHHAKFLALFGLLGQDHNTVVGYDLFEEQDQNIDKSGHGCRYTAERTLLKAGLSHSSVKLLQTNSLFLDSKTVIQDCDGQYSRMFSVDGGHTSDITYKDLDTAFHCLTTGGIVILDDYFNHGWPGVSEGASRFFFQHPSLCIPIAIGGNKIWLTNDQHIASIYMDAITNELPTSTWKTSRFLDQDVIIVEPFKSFSAHFAQRFQRLQNKFLSK